jgi:hypothetical protein
MIDIGTRKHGPFDPRYPRPRTRAADPADEPSVDRQLLDTWEGEGGKVESAACADGRGNRHRRVQPEVLLSGVSWERFYLLAYPGMARHYFPALSAWYRRLDADSPLEPAWPASTRLR